MSEKSPKRGILSSLMGLFGEDAQAEAEQERDKATQGASKGFEAPVPEAAEAGGPDGETNGTVTAPGSGSVVRESYEPGWYAVSTARTSRPTFVSEPWGGTTLPPVEAGATPEQIQDSAPAPAETAADVRPGDVESWRPEVPATESPIEEPAPHAPASIYTEPYSHQPVQVPDAPAYEEPPVPEQAHQEPQSEQSWQEPHPEQSWQEPQSEQSWQEPQSEQSWQEPHPEQSWEIPPPDAPVQSWQESQPVDSWEIPAPAPAEPQQPWEQPNQVV